MDDILTTFDVSKEEISKDSNAGVVKAIENINDMSVTFDVLKFERSNFVSPHAPENILLIVWTFEVSKVDKSKLVNEEHLENINDMSVTFDVLKFETSSLVRLLQPKNMSDILRQTSNPYSPHLSY